MSANPPKFVANSSPVRSAISSPGVGRAGLPRYWRVDILARVMSASVFTPNLVFNISLKFSSGIGTVCAEATGDQQHVNEIISNARRTPTLPCERIDLTDVRGGVNRLSTARKRPVSVGRDCPVSRHNSAKCRAQSIKCFTAGFIATLRKFIPFLLLR